MQTAKISRFGVSAMIIVLGAPALAGEKDKEKGKADCPAAVKAAIEKAHPGAKILGCEQEKEDGKEVMEAKIETKDGKKLGLEFDAANAIVMTKEKLAADALPPAVGKAVATKYAGAKIDKAKKVTAADGKVAYSVKLEVGADTKHATFTADGTFVGEKAPHKLAECPPPVQAAIDKAYPGAKLEGCKEEKEDGKPQFEAKLETKAGAKLGLEVSPTGGLLRTEEKIKLEALPAVVAKALGVKYPGAKATKAEKITPATGKVNYEIAFEAGKDRKEATFAADGAFVEEEAGE